MRPFRHAVRALSALALATSTIGCEVAADEQPGPENPEAKSQSTVVGCCGASSSDPNVNGLRVTIVPNEPIAPDSAAASFGVAPYTSAAIALFDGSSWIVRIADPAPPIVTGLAANQQFDVFAYWSGTDVRLEAVPWTSGSGNYLEKQDGVQVKSGDATRRYLGAVCTNATSQIQDGPSRRCVWNRYNQVARPIAIAPTGTWFYNNPNSVWRSAANDTFTPVTVIIGAVLRGSHVSIQAQSMGYPTTGSGWIATGIGINSSSSNVAQLGDLALGVGTSASYAHTTAYYEGEFSAGVHVIRWLETGSGSANYFFLGSPTTPTFGKTGLVGSITM